MEMSPVTRLKVEFDYERRLPPMRQKVNENAALQVLERVAHITVRSDCGRRGALRARNGKDSEVWGVSQVSQLGGETRVKTALSPFLPV